MNGANHDEDVPAYSNHQ